MACRHSINPCHLQSQSSLQSPRQAGYGAFAVSQSILAEVEAYIRNQQTHDANLSLENEFRAFLQRHGIRYDERYVPG